MRVGRLVAILCAGTLALPSVAAAVESVDGPIRHMRPEPGEPRGNRPAPFVRDGTLLSRGRRIDRDLDADALRQRQLDLVSTRAPLAGSPADRTPAPADPAQAPHDAAAIAHAAGAPTFRPWHLVLALGLAVLLLALTLRLVGRGRR